MRVAFVTGAFRGLGREICLAFREAGVDVVGIGRNSPLDPDEDGMRTIEWDMRDVGSVPVAEIEHVLSRGYQSVMLIHNAAVLAPLGSLTDVPIAQFQESLSVNLESPIALTQVISSRILASRASLKILFVSTGAARTPIAGWGTYCSTKAAMEMYVSCLSLDEPQIECVSFEPGVMDTKMQADIAEWHMSKGREVPMLELKLASEVAKSIVSDLLSRKSFLHD